MDGNRFDDLTRRFGSGLNRRQMLRGMLGGASAFAATAMLKENAEAQAIGDPCTDDDDCAGDLTCGPAASGCRCDVTMGNVTCPAGTQHEGQSKKPDGTCCNGNGNCCSNVCTNNLCAAGSPCSAAGVTCSATQLCCSGLICNATTGLCEVPDPCEGVTCQTCEVCVAGFCESTCTTGQVCCGNTCVTGDCCDSSDCADGCQACSGNVCSSLCPPEPCCTVGEPANWFCQAEGGCCFDEDCPVGEFCVNGFCEEPCSIEGEFCESFRDCCVGLVCFDDECVECIPEKGFCEFDEDCCKGLACFSNVCEVPKQVCAEKDELCKVDHDCCHGLRCADGKCRLKVDKPVEKPAEKDPIASVGELPSTGAGSGAGEASGILGMTLAGGAAALFAAKVLRRKPAEDTTEA